MGRVVIGMDPHKHSATIEVMDDRETVLGGGRFGTDTAGYRAMLGCARRWPERIWAVEGCQGIGGHIAARLIADGEQVLDVPPRLSARTRMFATGQGRKTDATDAHSVALWSSPSDRRLSARTRSTSSCRSSATGRSPLIRVATSRSGADLPAQEGSRQGTPRASEGHRQHAHPAHRNRALRRCAAARRSR